MKNNYDTCKDMEDCELSVSLDSDLSRINFEENFEVIQHQGYRETACYFFTDCGADKKPDCVSDCYDFSNCTEKDFRGFCIDELWTEGSLKEIIAEKREGFHTWRNYAIDGIESYGLPYYMAEGFPEINNAILKYETLKLTGYSQGDYCVVLYKPSDWLNDDNKASLIFHHYIYDSPVYARLEVNGEEFYLEEALQDSYTYDKGEIVAYVKAQGLSEKVIEWVTANLPDYPEYAY